MKSFRRGLSRREQRPERLWPAGANELTQPFAPLALIAVVVAPSERAQRQTMKDVFSRDADGAMQLMSDGRTFLRSGRGTDLGRDDLEPQFGIVEVPSLFQKPFKRIRRGPRGADRDGDLAGKLGYAVLNGLKSRNQPLEGTTLHDVVGRQRQYFL